MTLTHVGRDTLIAIMCGPRRSACAPRGGGHRSAPCGSRRREPPRRRPGCRGYEGGEIVETTWH
eukprot:2073625-Prymnesium_polylepis.1